MEISELDYIKGMLDAGPELARSYTMGRRGAEKEKLKTRYAYFKVKKYVDEFLSGDSSNRLVTLSGLRGLGKSTLVFQIYEYLADKGIQKDRLFYMPADQLKNMQSKSLSEAIGDYAGYMHESSLIELEGKRFFLIDEAHFDKEWAGVVKSVYDQSKDIFVLVTGSSAIGLSMNTDTARRSRNEALFPLCFSEYLLLRKGIYPPRYSSSKVKEFMLSGKVPARQINSIEKALGSSLKTKNLDAEKELDFFLEYGGLTSLLYSKSVEAQKIINDMVQKVITADLPQIYEFESGTNQSIFRIIGNLALKKPGETSQDKLSGILGKSTSLISRILDGLERTQLVFPIKPVPSGANAWARKPWKYYFLSPTLLYNLRISLGMDAKNIRSDGLMRETAVASALFRMAKTSAKPLGIYYDPNKKGNVDFVLMNELSGSKIPVEVGKGKDSSQVRDAVSRFDSPHGIVVSDFDRTERDGKIIRMPFVSSVY